jgi:hypothetical protein
MTPDEELVVIFGALHVIALALGVVLFMMFLRSDATSSWEPPEDDEGGGGGGNDRMPSRPKPRPTGGVPLPDAEPAGTRLRGHGKLRDAHRAPLRRPGHRPLPQRRPARSR